MRRIAAAVLFALFFVCHSIAQTTNASVTGFVMDPSKAVIPGVTVIAVNTDTNARFETHTDKGGAYVLPSLPAGPYRMQIEKPGFKTILKEDLDLHVQAALEINFQMAVGSAAESITVTGSQGEVQTTSAVSTVIDHTEIENMPLNGNSLSTLFELVPGVVTNAGGNPDNGGGISVNGQRATSNYLTIDGASGNIYAPGFSGNSGVPNVMGAGIALSASGGSNGLLPVDAVEEFRMQTSSYSAEYGRTPGGQIEVKTRGGTDAFHGSLFENFRNQVLDATDWFTDYYQEKQAPLRMNDFGGTLGGPAMKGKVFFFVAHESLYMNQPQTTERLDVPNAQTRSTAAASFQPYLNLYPNGNDGPDPDYTDSDIYLYTPSNITRVHTTSARVDANLPRDTRLFFRFNYAPSYLLDLSSGPFSIATFDTNILTFTGGATSKVSTRAVNELTVNYSSNTSPEDYEPTASYLHLAAGLANLSDVGVGFIPAHWMEMSAGVANKPRLSQVNIVDSFTTLFGNHSLKFGADYRRIAPVVTANGTLQLYADYSPSSIQQGVMDYTYADAVTDPPYITAMNVSLYAQDDWKVAKRLTLNLGLRWELNPPPSASGFGLTSMEGNVNDPSSITLAAKGAPLYKTQYDDFGPRIGFAYALRDRSRFGTSLRGGGGIFFDTGQDRAAAQASYLSYPYYQATGYLTNLTFANINYGTLEPQLTPAYTLPVPFLYLVDPGLRLPRTYQWSLTIDQQLWSSGVLTTSYIGNHGDALQKQSTYQGLSPSLANTLYLITNGEDSSYNSLQLQFREKTKTVDVMASYTFAHALDTGSTDFLGPGGLQPNLKADSDNDIRHTFASAAHYDPAGFTRSNFLRVVSSNWGVDAIVLAQSAAPLSVFAYNSNNPNLYNSYANIVPSVPVVIFRSGVPGGKQLNPAAFACAGGAMPPCPLVPSNGTSARNGYRLFGLRQFDLALSRSWPIWRESAMTFRVDAFNVFNHPNFANVDAHVGDATFGQAQSTYAAQYGGGNQPGEGLNQVFSNGGPRNIQLSLKLKF